MLNQKVRQFVVENFYVTKPEALNDDASLLSQGIIDSTGVLEIVTYLETTFGIEVDDAELLPENLDSIAGITRYIQRKQSANVAQVG